MKVSVITTLYNYRKYIPDCIMSFLRQDMTDSEMIIVDDCSNDKPLDVISKFLSGRVKYIKLDKNSGYSYAKNIGIKNSSSDILVMLDADDMLTESSLTMRFDKIQQGYDFVHGPVLDIKGEKRYISKLWKKWLNSSKSPDCYKLIHAQSVMLKKQIHKDIGLYDESLKCKSDREMWARIMYHGYKIGWVEDSVAFYRIHDKQMHKSKWKADNNDRLQRDVLGRISRRRKDLSDCIMLGD